MKSLLLTILLMTSFNSFASTSMVGEQDENRCIESMQDTRNQETFQEAKIEIEESQDSTSTSV